MSEAFEDERTPSLEQRPSPRQTPPKAVKRMPPQAATMMNGDAHGRQPPPPPLQQQQPQQPRQQQQQQPRPQRPPSQRPPGPPPKRTSQQQQQQQQQQLPPQSPKSQKSQNGGPPPPQRASQVPGGSRSSRHKSPSASRPPHAVEIHENGGDHSTSSTITEQKIKETRKDQSVERSSVASSSRAPPRPGLLEMGHNPSQKNMMSVNGTVDRNDEWVEINDDVYNMFFLSKFGGQAFWYAIYIFILKLSMFTFLAQDAVALAQPTDVSENVLVTEFFMLPVAVAMQDDLIATFYLLANIKYSPLVKMQNPHATKWKFHVANFCRGLDGMYSLFVNFVILIKATEVLSLFLNFAALQFLQTIDNIALRLCADGYLSERLEEVANNVMNAKLPNKNNQLYRSMDSILFLSTFSALLIAWAVISFGGDD